MAKFHPIIPAHDDGLIIPEIGNWGEKKYCLVGNYCNIFTSAMKGKWNLVYIDLFAGAGYARIRETGFIVKTSSLIAMSVPKPFDHYIFCECDEDKFAALKIRTEKENSKGTFSIDYIKGDSNINVDEIISRIPSFSNGLGVLTFCFVDPFSLNLHFETIKKLANNRVDFLILMALQMDANRNLMYYYRDKNNKIEKFLLNKDWRDEFKNPEKQSNTSFIKFLSDQYNMKMTEIGYVAPPDKERITMDSGVALYYLAFYSKHPLGNEFFEKIKKGCSGQLSMF